MLEKEPEYKDKPLVSQEELELRPLFNDFYKYLQVTTARDGEIVLPYGPNALLDTSFDRMLREPNVLGYLIGRLTLSSRVNEVMQDARLREGKTISDEDLPKFIIGSLSRLRTNGEWDNSQKSRETRNHLFTHAMTNHKDYPLVSAALELKDMLQHDGHEAYAVDAVVAVTKWYERIDKKKADLANSHTDHSAA